IWSATGRPTEELVPPKEAMVPVKAVEDGWRICASPCQSSTAPNAPDCRRPRGKLSFLPPFVRDNPLCPSIGYALVASPVLQDDPIKGGLDARDCCPCTRWPHNRAKAGSDQGSHRRHGEKLQC